MNDFKEITVEFKFFFCRALFIVKVAFAFQVLAVSGFDLECIFGETYGWIFVSGNSYGTKNVNITAPNQTVTSVNGLEPIYYRSQNVTMFSMLSQTVFYVPLGIETFFPDLQGMEIANSKLKSIKQADLKPFGKLKELWMYGNGLETLDGDLFEFNPELLFINIDNNILKTIGGNIFDGLKKVERINLLNDFCINKSAVSRCEVFELIAEMQEKCETEEEKLIREEAELVKTKTKICSGDNEALTVENKQLKTQLSSLQAKHNYDLASLDSANFNLQSQLSSLQTKIKLDLATLDGANLILRSQLASLQTYLKSCEENLDAALMNFHIIKNQAPFIAPSLSQGNNLICKFTKEKIFLDEKLSFTSYACNAQESKFEIAMTKVSKIFGDHLTGRNSNDVTAFVAINQKIIFMPINIGKLLPKIEKIVIESSGLTLIGKEDFKSFSDLNSISLRKNNLSSIEGGVFDELIHVEYLNLAYNQIISLPLRIFANLVELKTLNLSHNKLLSLFGNILPKNNVIAVFSVEHNRLRFVDSNVMEALRNAELINFNGNDCISAKYVKDNDRKTFSQLSEEIEYECEDK